MSEEPVQSVTENPQEFLMRTLSNRLARLNAEARDAEHEGGAS